MKLANLKIGLENTKVKSTLNNVFEILCESTWICFYCDFKPLVI